jgi:hypothetical protein
MVFDWMAAWSEPADASTVAESSILFITQSI